MESKIIHGDCFEEMKKLDSNSIDLVLTDPPYNMTAIKWDKPIDLEKWWVEIKRVLKERGCAIITASQPFTTDLINSNRKWFKYCLTWVKNTATGMATAKLRPMKYSEDVVVFYNKQGIFNPQRIKRISKSSLERYKYNLKSGEGSEHHNLKSVDKKYDLKTKNPSDVLFFNSTPQHKGKLHPTQKPVELFEYLIKSYSNKNQLVLDCFGGSGTTAIACCNLKRDFIIIEKELSYFQIIKDRLEKHGKIPTQATPMELSFNMGLEVQKSKISSPKSSPTEMTSPNPNILCGFAPISFFTRSR